MSTDQDRARHRRPRRLFIIPAITWASLVRIVGLVLIINEARIRGDERPTTLILYAAMIGLPGAFGGKKDGDK